MSEKRFTSKDYTIDYYTEIVDNEKELDPTIPNPSQRLLIGEAVDLLNEQDREIKQLKKELKEMKDKAYHYGDIAICETSSTFDEDLDELIKEIYGEEAELIKQKEIKETEEYNERLKEWMRKGCPL